MEVPDMGAEQQQTELTDVVLCYQSMGIALDASPAVVEETFRALSEQYKKKLASPDPVLKEEARVSLELMGEMYLKIRSSITYKAAEKDYEKKTGQAAAVRPVRPVHSAVAAKSLMMNCPRCNGSVLKGEKVCPICKSPILTAAERVMRTWLTPKRIIIYSLVLALAALAALTVLYPELFSIAKG
jgi:hypothetical protein